MKFYSVPNSCALAAHIALEEAGLPYEIVDVDFGREEQKSAGFRELNPLGRVPVLVTPQGELTEVAAILAYCAALKPDLAPADPWQAAQMASFNAFISSSLHVTFAHHRRPYRYADSEAAQAEIVRKAVNSFADQFALIEDGKLKGPWVMGEQYTVADPYLFLMSRWTWRIGVPLSDFPRVQDHYRRMADRPAVQRVLPQHDASPTSPRSIMAEA